MSDLITKDDCDKCKTNMAEQIDQIKNDVGDLKISNAKIETRLQNLDVNIKELKVSVGMLQTNNTDRIWDLVKMLLPAILAFSAAWVLK